MTDRMNGGSPVVQPQQYHTVPTAVITEAMQRDRYLSRGEGQELLGFFGTGLQRLAIAQTLTQYADRIVAAGANRIFVGGNPMAYLEKPEEPLGLPGSDYFIAEDYLSAVTRQKKEQASNRDRPRFVEASNPLVDWLKGTFSGGKPSVPSRFRTIDIARYGPVRMKRSLRDLSWFLRYVTYAIVAGDTSIISVNTRGLRGVIPEDVTVATLVALREMQWKAQTYFPKGGAAAALVGRYFDVLIEDYGVEKPDPQLRLGVSQHHAGLPLPQSYRDSASPRPRWVMKADLPDIEKDDVVRAAYRQVFERDVTDLYGPQLTASVSQVKGGLGTMKEFIRQLGKSRLYRQLYYEPYSISRSIELACRHFLGRGLSCLEEFQKYFDVISDHGFPALVDDFIDSPEYADYFGEETVPYLRGLGLEAQECRNWGPQLELFKYSAPVRKVPQFVTTFSGYQQPLPNQHPYGAGNDPLEIQFGAIFPQETRDPQAQPAHFSEDSRRILISNGATNGPADRPAAHLGRAPGSMAHHRLRWEAVVSPNGLNGSAGDDRHQTSFSLTRHSREAVIEATYRQVFGRAVWDGQRQRTIETQLKAGNITLREFVRQLAKSRPFRQLAWETLYVTKAIEYIHRRLLGRPTRDRREMARYYDLCARQGFYALVDALIDSAEYRDAFGDMGVPYERYLTPQGYAQRSPQGPGGWFKPREAPAIAGEWLQTYAKQAIAQAHAASNHNGRNLSTEPAAASTEPAAASTEPAAASTEPAATSTVAVQEPPPAVAAPDPPPSVNNGEAAAVTPAVTTPTEVSTPS
ncbi:MAG: phycobilisome rod-core linker polypeptide [Leptolyngbyaceae cyanobacterium]